MRLKTRERIHQSKQQSSSPPTGLQQSPDQASWLSDILDIYASRLYPIWPIVDVGELKRSLSSGPDDNPGLNQLATVVALCTVAQLKLETAQSSAPLALAVDDNDRWKPQSCEDISSLDSLRISFFKHVYYENQEGGGNTSLLYLRDAITKAQILRLEHETTYQPLSEADQQLYRRVLWLLFVTERYVAQNLSHELLEFKGFSR